MGFGVGVKQWVQAAAETLPSYNTMYLSGSAVSDVAIC